MLINTIHLNAGGNPPNGPATTGNRSGKGRGNNPPGGNKGK